MLRSIAGTLIGGAAGFGLHHWNTTGATVCTVGCQQGPAVPIIAGALLGLLAVLSAKP